MNQTAIPEAAPPSSPLAADAVDWLEEAGSLEDQLLGQARRTPDGDVVWLHPRSFAKGKNQPARLGPYLYNGVTGVALFLAAMEHLEPRDGRKDCILSALASLRRQLKDLVEHPEGAGDEPHRLGGFTGLGGYIYGFSMIGRWLAEPALLSEAAEIATLLTPDRIAADDALDVMSGCAGAALALLALDRFSPNSICGHAPVERAVACGEHLLARRATTEVGPRAWPCNGKPPRCGFAHGAAGIAYCLARLFEATGESRFRKAAEEGVAFEHLHYDPERGDWPLLGLSKPRFMSSWCNGAPGVALGRLGMLTLGDSEPVRQDLRAALRATQVYSGRIDDFLCCGRMGRAEVLLHAYETLGEDRLLQAAGEIASRVVSQGRDRDGLYPWLVPGDDRFAPTFFRGAAGVAYTFLRLARTSRLPCVLSMAVEI
jgi:lantibiotic modifying enzyme